MIFVIEKCTRYLDEINVGVLGGKLGTPFYYYKPKGIKSVVEDNLSFKSVETNKHWENRNLTNNYFHPVLRRQV